MANRLIIFIHGLGGSAIGTWAQFPTLLRNDPEISALYGEIEAFQYATSAIGASLPLSQIAHELSLFVETKSRERALDEIVFITHSQGGLLARRYLCDKLLCKADSNLNLPVFRLLTFATPHWGAYSNIVGNWMPGSRAQTKDLAFDAEAIISMNRDWTLVQAEERISVLRVVAFDDAVVPKFSALGASFEHNHRIVNGFGHTAIVKVNDTSHPSFAIAKNFLLTPTFHQPAVINMDNTPPVLSSGWDGNEEAFGNNRFIYSTRYVEFSGRQKEKDQLMAFLLKPTDANIAWMWLKGEGGTGKSRLALELCLSCQFDWHAGFLNSDADAPDWARWQPQMPTLIVVDYATKDLDKLGRMLRGLCNRGSHNRLRRSVRLLLIDRRQQEDRLETAIGHGRETIGINSCRHQDIELGTIDDPWLILKNFLERVGAPVPKKEDALRGLNRVDPGQRPLFAMLFADLLSQKVELDAITRESLLANVLSRERSKYWKPAAREHGVVLAKVERALAFATIVNGLSLSKVQEPVEPWDVDIAAPVLKVMAGYDYESDTISPLAPDLIGECFAIETLKTWNHQKLRAALTLAWNAWPADAFGFFDRVCQDFPSDPILEHAFMVVGLDRNGRSALSQWVANLIARTGADFPTRAQSATAAVAELAEEFQGEPVLRRMQAKALFLLIATEKPFNSETAMSRLREIDLIAEDFLQKHQILTWKAKAITHLVSEICSSDVVTALQLLSELRTLVVNYPQERSLRVDLAGTIFNLITQLSVENSTIAQSLLVELKELAQSYEEESELSVLYARSLSNAIATADLKIAEELLFEMRLLSDASSSAPKIRQAYASSISNFLMKLDATNQGKEGQLLVELGKLAIELRDLPDVRLLFVTAVANFFSDMTGVDSSTTGTLLEKIGELAENFEMESEIQIQFARATANYITEIKNVDLGRARQLLCVFSNWAHVFSNHLEIQRQLAKASFNLMSELRKVDSGAAKIIVEELESLSARFPEEAGVRLFYAKSICNIIASLGNDSPAVTELLLNRLRSVALAFPEETEIREAFAMTITSVIGLVGSSSLPFSRALLTELKALADQYFSEPKVRLEQAKATFNLVTHCGQSELAMAHELLSELRTLVSTYPAELKIRYIHALAINNLVLAIGENNTVEGWPLVEELLVLAEEYAEEFEAEIPQVMSIVRIAKEFIIQQAMNVTD